MATKTLDWLAGVQIGQRDTARRASNRRSQDYTVAGNVGEIPPTRARERKARRTGEVGCKRTGEDCRAREQTRCKQHRENPLFVYFHWFMVFC